MDCIVGNEREFKFFSNVETDENGDFIFVGKISQESPWKEGSLSSVFQNNRFSSLYLRWIGSSLDQIHTCPNLQAISYLLDENVWKPFAGENQGVKAVGAPTLELFIKSWNAAHKQNQMKEYGPEINTTNADNYGYKQYNSRTQTWQEYFVDSYEAGNMWFPEYGVGHRYYIASTVCEDSRYPGSGMSTLMTEYLSYQPSFFTATVLEGCGIRPIVMIPRN